MRRHCTVEAAWQRDQRDDSFKRPVAVCDSPNEHAGLWAVVQLMFPVTHSGGCLCMHGIELDAPRRLCLHRRLHILRGGEIREPDVPLNLLLGKSLDLHMNEKQAPKKVAEVCVSVMGRHHGACTETGRGGTQGGGHGRRERGDNMALQSGWIAGGGSMCPLFLWASRPCKLTSAPVLAQAHCATERENEGHAVRAKREEREGER